MTAKSVEVRRAETPQWLAQAPGFVVRKLYQSYTAAWWRSVGTGLTGPQYAVLAVLEEHNGSDQISVGAAAALDASTMVDVARRLEGRSLIVRSRSPIDARRKVVQITALGEAALAKTREQVRPLDRELFAHAPRRRAEIMADLDALSERWADLVTELGSAQD
ncbi:MarR family winged helix-turn-helix transcriptional regulator [Demetria terragena]|uniref:MarR family winged helix-turn-helix transcriptional regulator n=1 Tax=Demetria terragena TaxID=63959 RepID=UPI000364944C|nr:MarR family transcriptional regulator [Demetria terragena]